MEKSEGIFHEAVLKMYPYFFDLFDVIKDHSSCMPQINLKDLDENIVEPVSSSNNDNEYVIGNENVIQMDNQNENNTENQDHSQASNNKTLEVVFTITSADIVQIATPLKNEMGK